MASAVAARRRCFRFVLSLAPRSSPRVWERRRARAALRQRDGRRHHGLRHRLEGALALHGGTRRAGRRESVATRVGGALATSMQSSTQGARRANRSIGTLQAHAAS
eukprot:4830581-Pleurochrysis_carterae.AAC.2